MLDSSGAVVGHLLTTGTSTVVLYGATTRPVAVGRGVAGIGVPGVVDLGTPGLDTPQAPDVDVGVDLGVQLPGVVEPADARSWFLRMYLPFTEGLFSNSLADRASSPPWKNAISPGTPATLLTGGALPPATFDYHYFYRMDSAQDDASLELGLPTAARGLIPTGIPDFRRSSSLVASVLSGVGSTTDVTGSWAVKYEHPRVVQTPAGEWLMLLARQLIPGTDALDAATLETDFSKLTDPASESIRDLVAYLSPTPDFKAVYGPVLLVSSLDAVPGQTLRVWPGVPTGVFVDSTLRLFYTVQPSSSAFQEDDVGAIDYQLLVQAEFSDDRLSQGKGIIAQKSIAWSDLQTAFVTHLAESSAIGDAVSGTLRGRVRFAMAYGSRPSTEPFLDALEQHLSDRYAMDFSTAKDQAYLPNIVDPDVVLCPDGTLTMYVAVRSGTETDHLDGRTGMGIWRGVAPQTGIGSFLPLGSRFVMSELGPAGESEDLVLASDRATAGTEGGSYIDPDAVLLPDGSARVFCSGRGRADGSTPYGTVVEVSGSAADACADLQSAWSA